MKYIIPCILLLLFSQTVSAKTVIKILIASSRQSAVLMFDKGFVIQDERQKKYSYSMSTLNIKSSSDEFVFAGRKIPGKSIKIFPRDNVFEYNGNKYRDSIMLIKNGKYTFHVVNVLGLESYIYGVLKSEMLPSSPFEALCAQAVVARTWAVRNIGRHAAEGYDYCSSTHCQSYKGMSSEMDVTNRAVDKTHGQIVIWDGQPINAVYHSNCGGHTANNEDVWPGAPLPYLRGVRCPYCMNDVHHVWSLKVKRTLLDELVRKNLGISGVRELEVLERTLTGHVIRIRIHADKTTDVTGSVFRTAVGPQVLPSSKFYFSKTPENKASVSMILSDLNAKKEDDPIKDIISQYEKSAYFSERETIKVSGEEYLYFSGYGFGHGIGLCQEGACGMASQGMSYREILKYYYGKNISFQEAD